MDGLRSTLPTDAEATLKGGLRLTFRQPRLQKFAEIDSFFAVHRDINEGEVGPFSNHLSGEWQVAELVASKVRACGADLLLRGQGDADELQRWLVPGAPCG